MSEATRQQFRLDSVAGWRQARPSTLVATPVEGSLRLAPLVGRASPVAFGGVRVSCIRGLSVGRCGEWFALDAGAHSVYTISGDDPLEFKALPNMGGATGRGGARAREFAAPRGLAVDADGSLIVADTGNNRVQVFHPALWTLTALWEGFKTPWGVAVGEGHFYVTERDANRIAVFTRDSANRKYLADAGLKRPTAIARGPAGHLAVVGDRSIWVFDCRGTGTALPIDLERRPDRPDQSDQPTAIAFDHLGRLHVGTRAGLLWQFAPDAAGKFQSFGVGVSGVAGRIDAIVERPGIESGVAPQLLLAILRDGDQATTFWQASAEGACSQAGEFESQFLDSRIEGCVWHRIVLEGNIPQGSSVEIYTQTKPPESGDFQSTPDFRADGRDDPPTLPKNSLVENERHCLVQSPPGRWLRFKLLLKSSGVNSPEIRAVRVEYPRTSYLRFLPSVYQDDPDSRHFLDRFLSLFETTVNEENAAIDQIHRLFDPLTVPERQLAWLAHWLAFPLDPHWPPDRQRKLLAGAFAYYRRRGTPTGIRQAVEDFTDVAFAGVIEHFRLRPLPGLSGGAPLDRGLPLWSPRVYSRWQVGVQSQVGQIRLLDEPEPVVEPFAFHAHRFSVYFPAHPADPEPTVRQVARVVAAEKPAYTEATLCAVYPRFRVGVQSRIGIDSMIGDVSFMILSGHGQPRLSRLGYDTILNPSPDQAILQRHRLAALPAVSQTTQLL